MLDVTQSAVILVWVDGWSMVLWCCDWGVQRPEGACPMEWGEGSLFDVLQCPCIIVLVVVGGGG